MASFLGKCLLMLACVAGIYGAYLTQGIVSETLATKRFGPEEERFTELESLNGMQSVACFVWAYIILQVMLVTKTIRPDQMANWYDYWRAGITNSVGPAFGMVALRNITYSAQVLVKSCKMVPVMLVGAMLHGKKYSLVECLCMSLIGVGIALFGSASSSKVAKKLVNPNTPLGYSFCLINLVFDGYTNATQDEINKKHPKNPPMHMMCWMNFWTALYYSIYLFGFTNKGTHMVSFCAKHPDAAMDVLLFCVCGAVGQLFIFFTIKTFGSLVNTLICTTRKFFNILISVIMNANPLLPVQWAAVAMVFTGLIASSLTKARHHAAPKPAKQKTA